jgi:hypothetical protein
MKDVNFEIKRMLSLLESTMGNVKPLLSEQVEDEFSGGENTAENTLKRVLGSGCLTNKGAKNISGIQRWSAEYVGWVNKNNNTTIQPGELYVKFKMNDKNGREGAFYLFGKRGRGPEGTLYLLKRTQNSTTSGQEGFDQPHFIEDALKCPEFEISKSVTSDVTNLTADQEVRVKELVDAAGAKETNFSYTTKRPTSGVGKRYIAVDLNTGVGSDGRQYIKKTAVDTLKTDFPTPGKYYIWVDLGQEERLRDLPKDVEMLLFQMGYTREQPPIGSAEEYQVTTLKELCKRDVCEGGLKQYADDVEVGRRVWPMTAKQREDAERTYNIDIKTREEMVSSSGSGRQTRRGIKDIKKLNANKDSCRSAFQVLGECARSNSDASCSQYIQNVDITKGMQYTDAVMSLKDLVRECDTQGVKLTGVFGGGKSFEQIRQDLQKSTSKFSPYSSAEKREISLEESLTKNIRNTINEHVLRDRKRRRL